MVAKTPKPTFYDCHCPLQCDIDDGTEGNTGDTDDGTGGNDDNGLVVKSWRCHVSAVAPCVRFSAGDFIQKAPPQLLPTPTHLFAQSITEQLALEARPHSALQFSAFIHFIQQHTSAE